MKNQTVENLHQLAIEFAEKNDDLEIASDIQQFAGVKSPTELRIMLAKCYPNFESSLPDLALAEAEKVLRQN